MRTKQFTEELVTNNLLRAIWCVIVSIHSGTLAWIERRPRGQLEIPFQISNPLLDKEENWTEFTQEYGTWEQIIENRYFLNDAEERITIHSMDTSKDPQYYPLYKPKEGIPMYVPKEEPPVERFVVCKSKRKNNFPLWAKIIRVIISPFYLIPKKSIRRKKVVYTLNFTERFAMEFRVSKRALKSKID